MYKFVFLALLVLCCSRQVQSQVLTSEDSLSAGLVASNQRTLFSGYGEARASFDVKQKNAEVNLERVVLFVGHKFNKNISLFTEMELEDALVAGRVEGGQGGGEIAMEQAFLKFDINPSQYVVAGLFIPRIGIINENHLPTTFNGVERPFVEQFVIPSTWRGVGIGYYGRTQRIPGLNYSLSLTNGLNSAGFQHGSGIRDGLQLGSKAQGLGLMVSGSLLYYVQDFRLQYSSTIAGTTALEKRIADSLELPSGAFANPIYLNEANIQYRSNGIEIKVLASMLNIPSASSINRAFANNTPSRMLGTYAEIAYDVLHDESSPHQRNLLLFARAEYLDLNQQIAENGIHNDAQRKTFFIGGITYKPVKGVSIKADYTHRMTGEQNPALMVTPFPQAVPYFTRKSFINLGIAYNF